MKIIKNNNKYITQIHEWFNFALVLVHFRFLKFNRSTFSSKIFITLHV